MDEAIVPEVPAANGAAAENVQPFPAKKNKHQCSSFKNKELGKQALTIKSNSRNVFEVVAFSFEFKFVNR